MTPARRAAADASRGGRPAPPMPTLTIRLKRTSPTHHELSYARPDGTGETITLESRSCLYHDILHFAVETEAGLQKSFYGHLAHAASYAELSAMDASFKGEIGITERVVGGITGFLKSGATPEAFLSTMQMMFDAYAEPLPPWLTPDLLTRVKERMRRLVGEWTKTQFGRTMTLEFRLP